MKLWMVAALVVVSISVQAAEIVRSSRKVKASQSKSVNTKSQYCDRVLRDANLIVTEDGTINGKGDWIDKAAWNKYPDYPGDIPDKVTTDKNGKVSKVEHIDHIYSFDYGSDGTCIPSKIEVKKGNKFVVDLDLVTCKKLDNFIRENKLDVEKCASMSEKLQSILDESPMELEGVSSDSTTGRWMMVGALKQSCSDDFVEDMMKDPKVGAAIYQLNAANKKSSSEASGVNATK